TMAPVASVLALSTTTIAARNGSDAALAQSAASPPGSLAASLYAGTTISMDAGPNTGGVLVIRHVPRRLAGTVLVERCVARRACRGAIQRILQDKDPPNGDIHTDGDCDDQLDHGSCLLGSLINWRVTYT